MRTPTVRRGLLAAIAVLAGFAVPAVAAAHPLGNFTINHYAALSVAPDRIALDVIVDFAEIPAFQERIRIDADGDGAVDETETEAARDDECEALLPELELRLDGTRLDLTLVASGLAFPAGAGGVPTMRIVCELEADPDADVAGSVVTFADTSYDERIGWREIVVLGDGTVIGPADGGGAPLPEDVSKRLTDYPTSLLTQPLDVRSVAFSVAPGGPAAAPFTAPDAAPLDGTALASATPGASNAAAVVPGGVGADIPDLFRVADLTPILAAASILLAMALGAGHALTPGHGKTLMAAYLVGTRGTIRHAAGLGLAVTVSHTLGILALALLVTGAESLLSADAVVRVIPIVAALAFVAIGGSMVVGEVRRRRRGARLRAALAGDHDHDDPHHEHAHDPLGEHSHGGIRHTHLPAGDRTLTWKSLFALGLAGGIIPSTSALIILLGTIVAGRAAFGVVLVIAFGLGMALVLGGVGAAMVVARERLARLPSSSTLGRVAAQAPLVASVAVFGIGLWLTAQAIGGGPVL